MSRHIALRILSPDILHDVYNKCAHMVIEAPPIEHYRSIKNAQRVLNDKEVPTKDRAVYNDGGMIVVKDNGSIETYGDIPEEW